MCFIMLIIREILVNDRFGLGGFFYSLYLCTVQDADVHWNKNLA